MDSGFVFEAHQDTMIKWATSSLKNAFNIDGNPWSLNKLAPPNLPSVVLMKLSPV